MVPTPHRSLLSILRAEASQEKTGEGALPPEIRQSIVTLSETREFFQEVATTKNNNNNAPPPAVGILELTNKTKQNKTAALDKFEENAIFPFNVKLPLGCLYYFFTLKVQ